MKKMYLLVSAILLSSVAMAAAGNGTGTGTGGSAIDLEIFANVVDKIAVNQVDPIDFGNVLRGKTGTIREITKGKITVEKPTATTAFTLKFDKMKNIELLWMHANGSPAPSATETKVKIEGVVLDNALINPGTGNEGLISVTGNSQFLTAYEIGAHFDGADAALKPNLIATQRLGRYDGKVRITAEI